MPPPPTLKIAEIFASIQGEGLRQGEPTIFVRLAGCDLRCSFCDTKYAWSGGKTMTAARILDTVRAWRRRFPADWICLTGGEPFLQEITALCAGLNKTGLKVQIETNGRTFRRIAADWLTISPKSPGYVFHPRFKRLAREVKLVVSKSLTLQTIRRLRGEFPKPVPILLQPESNAAWSKAKAGRLLERAMKQGLSNIRLTCQLHKVLGRR